MERSGTRNEGEERAGGWACQPYDAMGDFIFNVAEIWSREMFQGGHVYRVVTLRVQGKRDLLSHCAHFRVIEPRGGHVYSFVCINVVCVMCGLCSIDTCFRHCAEFRFIQSRRRCICTFLDVKEAGTI